MALPILCTDLDNVIARTDEVMRLVIREHSAMHVDLSYEDIVCFDYWRCRDKEGRRIGKNEWTAIHEIFTRYYLDKIEPYDDMVTNVIRLARSFEIHIATSRMPHGREATLAWLQKHGIPYQELHFVGHGTKHLLARPFFAAIEDEREQAYAFHLRGVRAYLLAHPWNDVGPYSPLRRVSGWSDLVADMEKYHSTTC